MLEAASEQGRDPVNPWATASSPSLTTSPSGFIFITAWSVMKIGSWLHPINFGYCPSRSQALSLPAEGTLLCRVAHERSGTFAGMP